MTCKDVTKNTKLENSAIKQSAQSNITYTLYQPINTKYIAAPNYQIISSLEYIKKQISINPDYLKEIKETPLPQSTNVNIGKTFGVGKKIFLIDTKSSRGRN